MNNFVFSKIKGVKESEKNSVISEVSQADAEKEELAGHCRTFQKKYNETLQTIKEASSGWESEKKDYTSSYEKQISQIEETFENLDKNISELNTEVETLKSKYQSMIDDYKEEEDKFTVLSKEKEKEMMDKNSSLLTQLQEAEKERMSSQLKVTFVTSLDDSILKQTQNITLYQTKIPDLIVRLQDTKSMFGILKSLRVRCILEQVITFSYMITQL